MTVREGNQPMLYPPRRYPEAYLTLDQDQHRCELVEISPGAACIRSERQTLVPDGAEVMLEIPSHGRVPAEVVLLPDGIIGLLFLHGTQARQAMGEWIVSR